MILMEKEAIFQTDVETSKDFALILYADSVEVIHKSTGEVCSM